MIGRTNTGAGGGSCLAIIRVLYKAGTNATCTNGTITFLSDQSGDFLFQIPVVGTWTVTGQDLSGTTKTITLTINRGDAKLVTLDTLIPPDYRATYREVEYLRFLPWTDILGYGNIPLGFEAASGSWDFELQNVSLVAATRGDVNVFKFGESFIMVPHWRAGEASARLGVYNTDSSVMAVELDTKEDVVLTLPHTYKVHWSSISSEAKPAVLTADGVEQSSLTVQRGIVASSDCRVGLIAGGNYARSGGYGAIKVSVNNERVHHFVPCKKISSGADQGMPGYFDLCEQDSTKVFKQGYNQGVGTVQEVLEAIQPGPVFGT
jgi:hypothetical protein